MVTVEVEVPICAGHKQAVMEAALSRLMTDGLMLSDPPASPAGDRPSGRTTIEAPDTTMGTT